MATCLRFTRTTNTGMVPILPGGVVFMNRMWSLFSKSFSLKPYAQQSASDAFPRKKSFNRVLLFFGSQSHSSTWGITRVHLLSLPPVFCAAIMKFLILTSQLGGMEDDLLIRSFFFLDYLDILGLGPGSTSLCTWLSNSVTVSGSSLVLIQLRASATLLSEPLRYLMVIL